MFTQDYLDEMATDAYPAALQGIARVLDLALSSGSLGQGSETNTLVAISKAIRRTVKTRDAASLGLLDGEG